MPVFVFVRLFMHLSIYRMFCLCKKTSVSVYEGSFIFIEADANSCKQTKKKTSKQKCQNSKIIFV